VRVIVYFEGFAVDAGIASVCVCYGFSVSEVDDDAGICHIHPPNVKMILHVETLEQYVRRPDSEQKPPTWTQTEKKVRTRNSISYLGGGGWV